MEFRRPPHAARYAAAVIFAGAAAGAGFVYSQPHPLPPPPAPLHTTAPVTMAAAPANGRTLTIFLALDRAHRGYLVPSDLASNDYLARSFRRCDSNGDGRLTYDEVDACLPASPAR
ncbi:MAG TPA: hypothetical protein VFB32_16795 [Rudaea sp.]|nr:hypothetical protein [Rudaea sp.]